MIGHRCIWAAALCFLSVAIVIHTSAAEYIVMADPTQSNVQFTLGDILHRVHGLFKVQSGTIHFDPATGASSGQVVVDVASGNSGNVARDHRMQRDVLQSQIFPRAVFAPDRITGAFSPEADSELQVDGTITIHGAKHEITFPARVHVQNGEFDADGTFVMPYVEWGMKNPSTFILRVGEKVTLNLHLAGAIARAN